MFHDSSCSLNSHINVRNRQLGKAAIEIIFLFIVRQVFKVLRKRAVDKPQVLGSVYERTVAIDFMQDHPQFEREIAVIQPILDFLTKFIRLIDLIYDTVKLISVLFRLALDIAEMSNRWHRKRIRRFGIFQGTLLHLRTDGRSIRKIILPVDYFLQPFQIPLLCLSLNREAELYGLPKRLRNILIRTNWVRRAF